MTRRLFTVVIDDEPSVCRALSRLLRSAGMEVETYTGGEAFLNAARTREPDCLVLDLRMPGMSGPQLRDRLLSLGRPIPVVFITAHADAANGLRDGTTEILRKPFDGQALLDAIERATRGATN